MKKISIFIVFMYAPFLQGVFKVVQESTVEALQFYEDVDDIAQNQTVFDVDSDVDSDQKVEEDFDDIVSPQSVVLEKDPEQYFVDKKEVEARINAHEILEYTLDEVLDRAREYPGYYGDSDKDELTAWYEQAQKNSGYTKEVLDRIKSDCKKHSLEKILEHAQKYPLYKGLIPYQKIVDTYYEINPQKKSIAQHAFLRAVKFLHIDDHYADGFCEKDIHRFLMEYRKLPASLQETIMLEVVYGVPQKDGQSMKSAKSLADWIVAHQSEYPNLKESILVLKI